MSPDWKLGFHQGSSLARETYGGLAPLVLFRAFHAVAKAIVSEDRDGLHSIGDHDVWIANLDEVVAVSLLATCSHARPSGKYHRLLWIWVIEVADDEFVVRMNATPAFPLRLERQSDSARALQVRMVPVSRWVVAP